MTELSLKEILLLAKLKEKMQSLFIKKCYTKYQIAQMISANGYERSIIDKFIELGILKKKIEHFYLDEKVIDKLIEDNEQWEEIKKAINTLEEPFIEL